MRASNNSSQSLLSPRSRVFSDSAVNRSFDEIDLRRQIRVSAEILQRTICKDAVASEMRELDAHSYRLSLYSQWKDGVASVSSGLSHP